jgi:hypothetical protein
MLVRSSSVTCPARIAGPLADIAAALCAGKFGTYNVMHSTFKKILREGSTGATGATRGRRSPTPPSTYSARSACCGHLHALPPPEQEQRRLNNSLQEEPPPPLQMPTL